MRDAFRRSDPRGFCANRGIQVKHGWQHFAHDADMGVRGLGDSPAEAFEQAAVALTAVLTDPASVSPAQAVAIECPGSDLDYLLLDWLNALIYEMATRRMLFSKFAVTLEPDRLKATAWGERVDAERHRPAVEVKGATLTELAVAENPGGGWIAQCVVDV
jgi:SHS2 domain-containing protein